MTDIGISGVIIDILTLSTTFLLACWLGRKVFGLDRETSWLIGAGSSICGAAAVLATEPVVEAETNKVAVVARLICWCIIYCFDRGRQGDVATLFAFFKARTRTS